MTANTWLELDLVSKKSHCIRNTVFKTQCAEKRRWLSVSQEDSLSRTLPQWYPDLTIPFPRTKRKDISVCLSAAAYSFVWQQLEQTRIVPNILLFILLDCKLLSETEFICFDSAWGNNTHRDTNLTFYKKHFKCNLYYVVKVCSHLYFAKFLLPNAHQPTIPLPCNSWTLLPCIQLVMREVC